jgi:hypothetical protein
MAPPDAVPIVMPALDAGIQGAARWIAGSSPAMTNSYGHRTLDDHGSSGNFLTG